MRERHANGKKFFDLVKVYGPGWGLAATLVGLFLINAVQPGIVDGEPAGEMMALEAETADFADRIEGKDAGDWVLIDTGDVIVHVFRPEVREFYQLEKMWLNPGDTAATSS